MNEETEYTEIPLFHSLPTLTNHFHVILDADRAVSAC